MYDHYKKARNKSWEVLYDCKISDFPVDLGKIADFYGIKIALYSDTKLIQLFKEDALQGDGFVLQNRDETQVFINDKIHNRNRRRFTLAHELGHALLGHSLDEIHFRTSEIDSQTDHRRLRRMYSQETFSCRQLFLRHWIYIHQRKLWNSATSAANQQKSERSGYRSSAGEINLICIRQKEK